MSSQGPYRSRLFRYTSRQYRRAIDRSQRTWRQVKAAAQWGLHAVALPFLKLWEKVERSNFQLGSPTRVKTLFLARGGEERSQSDTPRWGYLLGSVQGTNDSADEAIARILAQLTILPIDADPSASTALPDSTALPASRTQNLLVQVNPEKSSASRPSVLSFPKAIAKRLSQRQSNTALATRPPARHLEATLAPTASATTSATAVVTVPTDTLVTSSLDIRAIASNLETQSLVMVSSTNDIFDLLSIPQQELLAQRIWQEVSLLEQSAPISLAPFPTTWSDTLDRLATLAELARDRITALPASTPRLLEAPPQHWQSFGDRLPEGLPVSKAAKQTFSATVEPLLKPLRSSTSSQSDTDSSPLALPAPVRDIARTLPEHLGTITTQLGSSLSQLNEKLSAAKPKPKQSPLSSQDSPWWDPPSLDSAVSAARAISYSLPQPVQRILSPLLPQQQPTEPPSHKSAVPFSPVPNTLPTPQSAWTQPLIPKHPPLASTVDISTPVLPPSSQPPQRLLNPPTEGFLRPEIRRSLNNRRRKLAARGSTQLRTNQPSTKQSPTVTGSRSTTAQRPTTQRPAIQRPVTNRRNNTRATSAPAPIQSPKRSASLKRSGQHRNTSVEAKPSYIEVEATPMGYETPAFRKGLNWLDRGVYVAEESALQAWEWWCDFIQSSDNNNAPTVNWGSRLLPTANSGEAIAKSNPSRWQSAATATTEFTLSLLQHLFPVLVKTSVLLARMGTWLSLKLLYWLWSEVLPVVVGVTITLTRWSLKNGIKLLFMLARNLSAKS